MLVSVAILVGHNFLPHDHDVDIKFLDQGSEHHGGKNTTAHHLEHGQNTEDHHDIFSFAQLDEGFIPAKFQIVGVELPTLYIATPEISHQLIVFNFPGGLVNYYRKHPPPANYFPDLPSRAPPSC